MEEITLSLIERRVKDLSTSARTGICIDFHAGIMKPFDIARVLWKKYKINLIETETITNVQHFGFLPLRSLYDLLSSGVTRQALVLEQGGSEISLFVQSFCTVNGFGIFGGSSCLTPSGIAKKADQPELM